MKLHKATAKCKRLTEIVVEKDAKNRFQSGALKRQLLTLSEGTVILTIRDPNITHHHQFCAKSEGQRKGQSER